MGGDEAPELGNVARVQVGDFLDLEEFQGARDLVGEDLDGALGAGLAAGHRPYRYARPTRVNFAPQAIAATMSAPFMIPVSMATSVLPPTALTT